MVLFTILTSMHSIHCRCRSHLPLFLTLTAALLLLLPVCSGLHLFAAKGFSSSSKKGSGLSKAVSKMLKENAGDVDKASEQYFSAGLQSLDEETRSLIGGSSGSKDVVQEGPVRDTFMELKWNTVAAFMPETAVEKEVRGGCATSELSTTRSIYLIISPGAGGAWGMRNDTSLSRD